MKNKLFDLEENIVTIAAVGGSITIAGVAAISSAEMSAMNKETTSAYQLLARKEELKDLSGELALEVSNLRDEMEANGTLPVEIFEIEDMSALPGIDPSAEIETALGFDVRAWIQNPGQIEPLSRSTLELTLAVDSLEDVYEDMSKI